MVNENLELGMYVIITHQKMLNWLPVIIDNVLERVDRFKYLDNKQSFIFIEKIVRKINFISRMNKGMSTETKITLIVNIERKISFRLSYYQNFYYLG